MSVNVENRGEAWKTVRVGWRSERVVSPSLDPSSRLPKSRLFSPSRPPTVLHPSFTERSHRNAVLVRIPFMVLRTAKYAFDRERNKESY